MRMIKLLCFVVFLFSLSFGQIPNAGFENWADDGSGNINPVGWETTNSPSSVSVDSVSPGHSGSYAMRVKTLDLGMGIKLPGVAILQAAYAFTQTPSKFGAWVKSTLMPGDTAYLLIALMKGGTPVAAADSCTFKIDSSYSQYTYLEFPIKVVSGEIPDSLYVMVTSGLSNTHVGTEIIVDDIAFIAGSVTNVVKEQNLPGGFFLEQNYPNPFNPETAVSFQLSAVSVVRLRIYDMLGRVAATLADGELAAGVHRATWNAGDRASGTYLIRLEANGFVETRKMVLIR